MDDKVNALERQYCPPIDPALFSAILYDYNELNDDAIQSIRGTLDALKDSALLEEDTGFDPSGSSGPAYSDPQVNKDMSEGGHSLPEMAEECDSALRSEETGPTSVSRSLASLSLLDGESGSENEAQVGQIQGQALLEALDTAAQEVLLQEMFPDTNSFTISHTLKKCQGNFGRAVEDLLNQVYFDERGSDGERRIVTKGVEAFADHELAFRGRKGKGKGKRRKWRSTTEHSGGPSSQLAHPTDKNSNDSNNQWDNARRDVDFIVSRTTLAQLPVSAIYRQNGGSMSATLYRLLEIEQKQTTSVFSEDPEVQVKAFELGQDFPSVPSAYLVTLIRLTHPSTAAAHELAKALIKDPPPKATNGGLQIITRYSPIDLTTTSPEINAQASPITNLSLSTANSAAASHNLARQAAFKQASAAYRRGRSDHLMRGAASYYSSVGRGFDAKAKAYGAAAADALVSSQSSKSAVDLHGVNVRDAVRIAEDRVSNWWAGLGDTRYAAGSGTGREYKIITGVGHHSEGGRSRLGPAVEKMLEREGWQFNRGEGVLLVTGATRNRR
ncbi:MAG: hypothetical protein M1835_004152 [Candelina submexicana]|nr:MAG: hypothetical protein M1835_004152 [Candelina submexicana]